ncbi:hypothetical protein ES319_A04G000500v1 [Gossypium barbadense]|uniref:Uncharacterized protein n=1 Tax=Gossypium barbadense TaxID=3634 RepID=A0A5J5W1T2_GOSBA|nr:hypothetical protein ES319_A04G000500v1 [Gossypium barbadense]
MGWFRGFWIGFLSCTKCFDALWFCYSPVHQLQQYYRGVVLDNCYGKWSALWDCLYLKTKPSSQLQDCKDIVPFLFFEIFGIPCFISGIISLPFLCCDFCNPCFMED